MSAGQMPKKSDRKAVVIRIRQKLLHALDILKTCTDPDKDPRKLEIVSSLLSGALGDFHDDGTHLHDPTAPKTPGLRYLLEHYFS